MPLLEDVKIRLEELGLSSDQIDQALAEFTQKIEHTPVPDSSRDILFSLWQEKERATDWREKARIQAKIISEKIDV